MKGRIYTLSCSVMMNVFYIGCTTKELSARVIGHNSSKKRHGTNVYRYMSDNNIIPIIEIIEEVECEYRSELMKLEEFWIEQFRQWGFRLKNTQNASPNKYAIRPLKGSGSMKVDPYVLQEAKEYCKENGLVLHRFVTEALNNKLNADIKRVINGCSR